MCGYLYGNKITSLSQFDELFTKYEARGQPFYSTKNLFEDLYQNYNLNSIDFTSLNLKEDIEKLNQGKLSYIEYFKRVFEELEKGYAEPYIYSFKDLSVRYGIMNNYEADYSSFENNRSVIKEYLIGLENSGEARAVSDDEEVIQYRAQFGNDQAFWLGAKYLEEITIADGAAQGNFMLQKFAIRKNLFTGRSGVRNGYRRFKIVLESEFDNRLKKLGLNDLENELTFSDKKKFFSDFKHVNDEVLIAFNQNQAEILPGWEYLNKASAKVRKNYINAGRLVEYKKLGGGGLIDFTNITQEKFDNWIKPKLHDLIWNNLKRIETKYSLTLKNKGIMSNLYVEDGFVLGYINISNEYHKGLGIGKDFFSETIDYFKDIKKVEIKGIRGIWLNKDGIRDNYDAFINAYNGNNFEDAAFKTATGRIAKSLGYTKVDKDLSFIDKNTMNEIQVFFVE